MLLSDFKSLGQLSGIGMDEFIPYLQSAYYYVINKIKLSVGIHKTVFTGAMRLDQFNNMALYYDSNSEIAFKEVPICLRTNEVQTYAEEYTLSVPIIGQSLTNTYTPEIYTNGSDIVCTNMDECYVLLLGYIYPYLVTTVSGYKIEEHWYDAQDMIDEYGYTNLYIDDALCYLCGLKIMSLYLLDNGSISEASNYDYLLAQLINMYNQNTETIKFDTTTIDQGLLLH